jgi:hypothetical protein
MIATVETTAMDRTPPMGMVTAVAEITVAAMAKEMAAVAAATAGEVAGEMAAVAIAETAL